MANDIDLRVAMAHFIRHDSHQNTEFSKMCANPSLDAEILATTSIDLPTDIYMALGLGNPCVTTEVTECNGSQSGYKRSHDNESITPCDSTSSNPMVTYSYSSMLLPHYNSKKVVCLEENDSYDVKLTNILEDSQTSSSSFNSEDSTQNIFQSPHSSTRTGETDSENSETRSGRNEPLSKGKVRCRRVVGRDHVLPPCKVCGDQATGFHYGVNTCEACKGFFRRCLVSKNFSKACKNIGDTTCDPNGAVKGKLCRACRYAKCLEAGMSVEGIKTGRYTYKKKTQDIVELKKLKYKETCAGQALQRRVIETQAVETVNIVMNAQQQHLAYSLKHMRSLNALGPEKMKSEILSGSPAFLLWQGLEKGLTQHVKFMKALNPFKELSLGDQMHLLKGTIFEVWMVSRHKCFSPDTGAYLSPHGPTFYLDGFVDKEVVECIFTTARALERLNLTPEETVVLKALITFFTDRFTVEQPVLVEQVQAQLLYGLKYLLQRNHSENKYLLAKVIGTLSELRTLSHALGKNMQRILKGFDPQKTPLLKEVLGASLEA